MKASNLYFTLLSLGVAVVAYALVSAFAHLLAMLFSGTPLKPNFTPAVFAGLAYVLFGIFSGFRSKDFSAATMQKTVFCFFVYSGVSLLVSPLAGFSSELLITLALAVFIVLFANRYADLVFRGMSPARLNRYQFEVIVIRFFRGLGYVFFGAAVFFPFYVMVMSSVKSQSALLQDPLDYSITLESGLAGLLDGYVKLFAEYEFHRYMLMSAWVSIATVVLTVLFAIPGAYAVARLKFAGRRALSRSILLIYMVPAIVLVIPLYGIFSLLGLRDNPVGLLIVYPATTLPVAVYMLKGYFMNIPAELEEAGMIDGCGRLGVILKITLPLCVPALASVGLYVFMIAWNEFLFAFMFLDTPDFFTISRAVVSLNSSEVPRQYLMAGAVLVTLPVLLLFLWFERYLVQGLTAGSVKG